MTVPGGQPATPLLASAYSDCDAQPKYGEGLGAADGVREREGVAVADGDRVLLTVTDVV